MEGLGAGAFGWARAMDVPVAATCSAPTVAEEGADLIARVCAMHRAVRNSVMRCWHLPRQESEDADVQRHSANDRTFGGWPEDLVLLLRRDELHWQ